jgi:hypothetical protein
MDDAFLQQDYVTALKHAFLLADSLICERCKSLRYLLFKT